MSADRELLERAAKAAGMVVLADGVEWPREKTGWFFNQVGDNPPALYDRASNTLTKWAPLTDDGDALRLAVKLGMLFDYMHERFEAFQRFYREELDKDMRPSEATRRAVVRVAAEIGRMMP